MDKKRAMKAWGGCLTLAVLILAPSLAADEADFAEAALRLREGMGPSAPSEMALRLSLEEGQAYLSGLEPAAAARLACDMAQRVELRVRFGSSRAEARLSLRRGYAEMMRMGAAEGSRKIERAIEIRRDADAGRGEAAADWLTPVKRGPGTTPAPGTGR